MTLIHLGERRAGFKATCACGDLAELEIYAGHDSIIHRAYEEMRLANDIEEILLITTFEAFKIELSQDYTENLGMTAVAYIKMLNSRLQ